MIKKLKSKSGAALILAMIFFLLMWFLTESSLEIVISESSTVNSFKENEYNYFIVKAALNHYSELFSGLQYTETADAPFTLPSSTSETYTQGEFQIVDVDPTTGSYSVDNDRTEAFELLLNIDDFTDAFAYFQRLRSEVKSGGVTLSTMDAMYKPAYQGFSVNFIIEGLENPSDPANDYVLTTSVTFFGELVTYDSFNSFDENTARIKVNLSCNDVLVYSRSITCVPELDDSSGVNIWTWEDFN